MTHNTSDEEIVEEFDLFYASIQGTEDWHSKISEWWLDKISQIHQSEAQKREEVVREIYSNLYNDLLRTEAILAQRAVDGEDEFSEEACYNRGYFEAVDDIAKRVAKLKEALTSDVTSREV